LLPKDLNRINK